MCTVLDEIETRGIEKEIAKGLEKGIEKGKIEMLCQLVKEKLISIEQAAAQINMSIPEFKKVAGIR